MTKKNVKKAVENVLGRLEGKGYLAVPAASLENEMATLLEFQMLDNHLKKIIRVFYFANRSLSLDELIAEFVKRYSDKTEANFFWVGTALRLILMDTDLLSETYFEKEENFRFALNNRACFNDEDFNF